MSTGQILLVFGIGWWMVFFTTLPFGVHPDENPEPGFEPGAPTRPRLWLKAAVTTLITGTLTAVLYTLVEYDVINIREYLTTP